MLLKKRLEFGLAGLLVAIMFFTVMGTCYLFTPQWGLGFMWFIGDIVLAMFFFAWCPVYQLLEEET